MLSSYQDVVAFREAFLNDFPELNQGRVVVASLDDPQAFWQFYRENKSELRQANFFVYKDGFDWICAAKPLYNPEVREKELLAADLEKWRDLLVGCCVPFEQMTIEEHTKKNGVAWYRLLCPVCNRWRSGGLPFRLVEHLLKERGLALVLRSDRLREVCHGESRSHGTSSNR